MLSHVNKRYHTCRGPNIVIIAQHRVIITVLKSDVTVVSSRVLLFFFFLSQLRFVEGMYSVFLEDWLRIFSRDQIMVMRNEDYHEDVEGHIMEIFRFLGVSKS